MPLTAESWLQDMLHGELQPGEQLLWTGMTDPDPRRGGFDVKYLVGFGVVWTAVLILIGWQRRTASGSEVALLVLFSLIGAAFLFAPIWGPAWAKRARMAYAITSRRMLILRHGPIPGPRVRSLWPADGERAIQVVERADRYGDLVFAQRGWSSADEEQFIFHGIPDVRSVEKLARDVFEKVRASTPAAP